MELITLQEAAILRGVSVAAITELVRRGRLESFEKYGRKLVRRGDVQNFEPEKRGWPKGKPRKDKAEAASKASKKKRGKT